MQVGEISQLYVADWIWTRWLQQDPVPGIRRHQPARGFARLAWARVRRRTCARTVGLFARRSGIEIRWHRSESREADDRASPRRLARNRNRSDTLAGAAAGASTTIGI